MKTHVQDVCERVYMHKRWSVLSTLCVVFLVAFSEAEIRMVTAGVTEGIDKPTH